LALLERRKMDKDRDAEELAALEAMAAIKPSDAVSRRTFVKGAAGAATTFGFLISPVGYTKPTLSRGPRPRGGRPHSLTTSHTESDPSSESSDD
jgi:hypothetical protein